MKKRIIKYTATGLLVLLVLGSVGLNVRALFTTYKVNYTNAVVSQVLSGMLDQIKKTGEISITTSEKTVVLIEKSPTMIVHPPGTPTTEIKK